MRIVRFAFVTAVVFVSLMTPRAARANSVLVNINVSITGNSVCGPTNNAPCIENLGGSFVWDNTAQSAVPGTVGITSISGPINFATLGVSGLLTSVLPPQNSIQATFSDPGGDFATFAINFLGPNLPLGTYAFAAGSQVPGTFTETAGQCVTALCNSTLNGGNVTGTITVTPTPEPSPALLLGTGLLGLAALSWRRWRLA